MADKNEYIREDLENLRRDTYKLKDDLSAITSKIFQAGKDEGVAAKDYLYDESVKLVDELENILNESRIRSKRKIRDASRSVENRPFLSVFIAFIAGMIISSILRGRD